MASKRSNKIAAMNRKKDIFDMMLKGSSDYKIKGMLMEKHLLSIESSRVELINARKELDKKKEFTVENIIDVHIPRYESMYEDLMDLGADNTAINVLKQKEKFLGMNQEHLTFNVFSGGDDSDIDKNYEINNLTPDEQGRFSSLMSKISINE